MTTNGQFLPVRTALTYAFCATLWIVLSDRVLNWSLGLPTDFSVAGTLKGLAFVAATSLILYALLARLLRRISAAESALVENEKRWRLALDGVGDGVWDWKPPTGEVYYSPRLQQMLGYAAGEFSGKVDEWAQRLHPDDAAATNAAVNRHLLGESAVYESEHRLRCKDGGYRWILDRGVVIERGAVGEPLRMVGTHTDITLRKELEAKLLEQAARYQTLFEQNPHPMWIYETESYRILAVNDFAVQKYGYTQEEFLGMTILDLRPPEDVPRLLSSLDRPAPPVQTTGPWRHRKANGEIILVEIMSHQITWLGRTARMVVAHDITAQQRAVHVIEESEQKFRAIFQSANDAIFIADENYIITDCNPRGLELFHATPEQLIGHPIPEFFPERQPEGSDSRTRARRLLRDVWTAPGAPFEWVHRRPDGTCFPSESTLSGLDNNGCRSIVVVVRDISERQRATQRLQLLQAALQATPAGIVITTADGTIDWVNPSFTRLTGYALEELVGKNPRVLRSGEHDREFYRSMWQTITRGEIWSGEIQNRRKNGTLYFEHMTIAPVRDAGGAITHYIAVKEDVTNERRLEQQLARAQRLESVGMLASGIAHDLNNVLTPIILSVELLKSTNALPQAGDRLDLVAQAAQRGANIVKQVLTFARGVDGERTTVQTRYLVKEVAQLAEETFPRNIEVRVECGKDVSAILGDVTQLHQVLLNLAVNARDAMPAGGRLVLGARDVSIEEARAKLVGRIAPGRYVEIAVSDTGTGITDEVVEHMFEPFFTTKPRGKGTGLGLSTVYGILRSHGGGIEVHTTLARGTTFYVLLPIPTVAAGTAPPFAAPPELRGEGRLVLLVDDEEPIRVVGEHVLRRYGFTVVTAADGVQALQIFRLRPRDFSLAIVDHMMPRMGGVALVRELRGIAPELKVITSTGLSGEPGAEHSEAEELARLNIRTRLPKPYSSVELLAALRRELIGPVT
ncbi:MAG: hypothetical protein C0518_02030 [Opitutus sp.]|nr:hypothetical protein [Opitutus sp.]